MKQVTRLTLPREGYPALATVQMPPDSATRIFGDVEIYIGWELFDSRADAFGMGRRPKYTVFVNLYAVHFSLPFNAV